jgi:competence/damage-inducible protein CinA C-terminal domain
MTSEEIALLLAEKNITLSIAESCTGGMIGSLLTSIPGSSDFFLGGVVTYSNLSKENILRVPHPILERFGAVSKETATEMAVGVMNLFDSDVSASVTGIAGPGGGTELKPVGLVFTAVSNGKITDVRRHLFEGNRTTIRTSAAEAVLLHIEDLVRNRI